MMRKNWNEIFPDGQTNIVNVETWKCKIYNAHEFDERPTLNFLADNNCWVS